MPLRLPTHPFLVQYYLPDENVVNKDFLKDVLVGKKQLMKKADVQQVAVPHYDELSVKALWPEVNKDPQFTQYFPDKYPAGRGPPRQYFFDILNTLYPEYLDKILAHASKERMAADGQNMQEQSIRISQFWQEELKAMPYLSRKYDHLPSTNLPVFRCREERQDAEPPQAELKEDHHWQAAQEDRHQGLPAGLERRPVGAAAELAAGGRQLAAVVAELGVPHATAHPDPRPPVQVEEPDEQLDSVDAGPQRHGRRQRNEEEVKFES